MSTRDSVGGSNLKPTSGGGGGKPAGSDSGKRANFIPTEPFASPKFPPTGENWRVAP